MARKSWMDVMWPVGGIDRSMPYQRQPPYTCVDALNVRTEGSKEFRERGGSRPGLSLTFRTQLPGPIRMLTKVGVLKLGWDRDLSPLNGTHLRDVLNSIDGRIPVFRYGQVGSHYGSSLTGNFTVGVPTVPIDSSVLPYEMSIDLVPSSGEMLEGEAAIHFDMPTPSSDPLVDGKVAKIVFDGAGSYSATLELYASSSLTDSDSSGTFTDNPRSTGTFTVRVTPSTGNIKVYWRNQLLIDYGAGVPSGWSWLNGSGHTNLGGNGMAWQGAVTGGAPLSGTGNWGIDLVAEGENSDKIQITQVKHDYGKNKTVGHVPAETRRDLVVAVSEGEIWVEDTVDTLVKVITPITLRADQALTAVDREQKLFIADFGMLFDGLGGSINDGNGSYTTLDAGVVASSADTTHALEIVDADYTQDQIQLLELVADGGTFTLGFLGKFTGNLNYDATQSTIKSALEGLSTVGVSNVVVTGAVGGPFQIKFEGDFAGKNQQLIRTNVDNLTHTIDTASATISEFQTAGGAELIVGTYQIVESAGNDIEFYPPLPVFEGKTGAIGSVEFRVVRTPKVFTPKDNTVEPHLASKGSAPAGCRLIANYRDRIVYAASDILPNVWYMSRQGDPFDWDYTQEDSGAAIFAQAAVAGELADPITALIAHGDECLIVGAYNSLWIIRGDPGYGGTMDQLSRKVGIVGPNAWCRTPDDMCIFLSHDGLFVMPAGCAGFPTSLSRERMPNELLCLNADESAVSLEYDSVFRGVHIMLTKHDGSEGDHWWFDWEAKSFWRVQLQQDHDPFSQHERNAWELCPITLQGGRDGYIRHFNRDEEVDDGDNEISSHCYLGPFFLDRKGFREGVLSELQGTLGTGSGTVVWSVHVGDSAQQAFEATARESGEWGPGLNYNEHPRARGVSACIKLSNKPGSKKRWLLERVTAVIRGAGRKRVKG